MYFENFWVCHCTLVQIEILLGAIGAQASANARRRYDRKVIGADGIGRAVEGEVGHGVGRIPERHWRKLQL
jgi:hypothetical protein